MREAGTIQRLVLTQVCAYVMAARAMDMVKNTTEGAFPSWGMRRVPDESATEKLGRKWEESPQPPPLQQGVRERVVQD